MELRSIFTLPAPAKVNWFLRVLSQREDGYHNLQTLFLFADLCDQLRFQARADQQIQVDCPIPGLAPEANLIYRAALAMQAHAAADVSPGVTIQVDKKLPVGAGLGGGSSNAATTLLGLNYLWRCQLSQAQLLALALALGADVPIFVHGKAAWAEGIGEQLVPVACQTPPWLLILSPEQPVATAEIFAHPDLQRNQNPLPVGEIPADHENTLQPLVCRLYPEIKRALNWLQSQQFAWLTGSGCAIVSSFETEAAARAVCDQIPRPWRGYVAALRHESPLLAAVNTL